ncbi:unnamed protein product [Rotaria sp. Silwood2]|nr:unnamed protein product [Rotaria sp. Silwood2]CAF2465461.1 unnamed protein product [Rotaria sp. Silwood2]CAF2854654.1 unnamed protein product [Rotaria sp. Silwood2]
MGPNTSDVDDDKNDKSSEKQATNVSDSDSDSDLDEEEYIVERVVKMRTTKKGKVQYLLKWKGFSESENTWVKNNLFFSLNLVFLIVSLFQEPAENLECPDLIAAFMAEQKEKQQQQASTSKSDDNSYGKRSRSTSSTNNNNNHNHNNNADGDKNNNNNTTQTKRPRIEFDQTGYGRGLVPDMLLGATDIYDGELMFLVKWQGVNKAELVPSRIVNKQSPQLVIKFYEERLTWNSTNTSNNTSNKDKKA